MIALGHGFISKKKLEYNNPFMWCLIPPKSFLYLYNNFKTINFKNFELKKDGEWYKIVIDKKIEVYYPHYKFDKNATSPEKCKGRDIDVYYCRIYEYILEKYQTRLYRMSGTPIFIINDTKTELVSGKCKFYKEAAKIIIQHIGL